MYSCKILYDANMYGWDAMRFANDFPRIAAVHVARKTVDYRAGVFLHRSKQSMF